MEDLVIHNYGKFYARITCEDCGCEFSVRKKSSLISRNYFLNGGEVKCPMCGTRYWIDDIPSEYEDELQEET